MSTSARVTSIESLDRFKAHLAKFGGEAREALVSADMEIRRTFEWLQERLKFWQNMVARCEQEVGVAKIELNRKKIARVFGRQPDCTEQEENLRKAKQRLHHAEAKVERVKRWTPQLQHHVTEFDGPARALGTRLELDLPNALADLAKRIAALDAYVKLAPPPAPGNAGLVGSTAGTSSADAQPVPSEAPASPAPQ